MVQPEIMKNPPKSDILLLLWLITLSMGSFTTAAQPQATFAAITIGEANTTPTVDLPQYVLVTRNETTDKPEAAKILAVKRRWPLAMQSLKKEEFEAILSQDFTFTDGKTVFNREAYIRDRTTSSDWKIVHVSYHNVTLQIFGDIAVMGYRNIIRNVHTGTNETEIERISWTDVFRKEKGIWKIAASQVTDFTLEK